MPKNMESWYKNGWSYYIKAVDFLANSAPVLIKTFTQLYYFHVFPQIEIEQYHLIATLIVSFESNLDIL